MGYKGGRRLVGKGREKWLDGGGLMAIEYVRKNKRRLSRYYPNASVICKKEKSLGSFEDKVSYRMTEASRFTRYSRYLPR